MKRKEYREDTRKIDYITPAEAEKAMGITNKPITAAMAAEACDIFNARKEFYGPEAAYQEYKNYEANRRARVERAGLREKSGAEKARDKYIGKMTRRSKKWLN